MRFFYPVVLAFSLGLFLYACIESDIKKGERLAKTYCSSCHLFPEPSLLGKNTWKTGIMPKMAFRMGVDLSLLSNVSDEDFNTVVGSLPPNPMVNEEEWELIKKYYQENAPDSLSIKFTNAENLRQFISEQWEMPDHSLPLATLIKADPQNKTIWLGKRTSQLYTLNYNLQLIDSIKLSSPASELLFKPEGKPLTLTMGNMDPSDQSIGSLIEFQENGKTISILDSLKRPVFIEGSDLNNDQLTDYVVCNFGNYTGSLSIYQNEGNNSFKHQVLSPLPGARKTIIHDFDNDGRKDIMALTTQGDEKILLFLNAGNFKFRMVTVLRFPPVYGSSYFELADFNSDGNLDILYSNGDNADFSSVLKPYHGLRIFANQGNLSFEEVFFFPFNGASQTIAHDFDQDGDQDIAAISFFPDFRFPEQGFVYLENTNRGYTFKAFESKMAASARWLRMEIADLDSDADMDIMLAALNFEDGVPHELKMEWKKKRTALLILRNQFK